MLRCILYFRLSILNKTRRSRLFYFFRIAFRVYSLVFSQKAKKICSGGKNILVIWNQTIWVRIVRSVLINISLSEIRAFKKRKKEWLRNFFSSPTNVVQARISLSDTCSIAFLNERYIGYLFVRVLNLTFCSE